MSRKRFHGLKKVKVRATWSKYNLYNLSRMKIPNYYPRTAYQQRWIGKSITRAYHGEHIREKQWERMFRPRANSVVPMDHRYLAEHDGSEQAAGRGSGLDVYEPPKKPDDKPKEKPKIPYMNMTYAPIERRLDMAIWRSLFASSARQARQFVIHGNVRVNGQKMPYPGYLLNPGDMFQVEPERVLFATGAVKEKLPKVERLIEKENRIARQHIARETRPAKLKKSTTSTITSVGSLSGINIEDVRKERRQDFQGFLLRLDDEIKKATSAKRKQDLRAVRKDVMTVTRNLNQRTAETLDDDLNRLLAKMTIAAPSKEEVAEAEAGERAVQAGSKAQEPTPEYVKALREAMVKARENPVDNSKPYATPWEPRPYMSAFAFIPRYLEVNHSICSGVYLRHPVARPTLAEVPSPFPQEVQQLAFNWYLRRR